MTSKLKAVGGCSSRQLQGAGHIVAAALQATHSPLSMASVESGGNTSIEEIIQRSSETVGQSVTEPGLPTAQPNERTGRYTTGTGRGARWQQRAMSTGKRR